MISARTNDNGAFTLVASNAFGVSTARVATLTVRQSPRPPRGVGGRVERGVQRAGFCQPPTMARAYSITYSNGYVGQGV